MKTKKWLLVRGLARESRHWGEFTNYLQEHVDVDEVLTCDIPGAGIFSHMTAKTTISATVDFLRGEFLKKKTDGQWGIISISLGGMIALDWCSRYPGDFGPVVVLSSSSSSLSPLFERLTPHGISKLISMALTKSYRKKEAKVLDLTCNIYKADDAELDRREMIQVESGVSLPNVGRQLFGALRFSSPDKAQIQNDLLFLSGLQDKMVRPICSKKLSEYYGGKLVAHETSGHDLTYDCPQWVISEIMSWNQSL